MFFLSIMMLLVKKVSFFSFKLPLCQNFNLSGTNFLICESQIHNSSFEVSFKKIILPLLKTINLEI